MNFLRKQLEQTISIDEAEWEVIKALFVSKSFKKGDLIQHAGNVFNKLYYIRSGVARSYFLDPNGKEITWQLYFKDESSSKINLFLDDSISYYEDAGSLLSFEVLEDAEFSMIELAKLEDLYNSDKKWQFLGRMISHNTYYASTFKRVLSMMSETAEQRYERLLADYPNIFSNIKSYHIASYLGIAPQTLSKLRKNESR